MGSAEKRWTMSYNKNDFGQKKETGKKGFYLSICTALICLMAVGTVYYKTNYPTADNDSQNQLASQSTGQPVATSAGGSGIATENVQGDGTEDAALSSEETQEASTIINGKNSKKDKNSQKSSESDEKTKKQKEKDSIETMSKETNEIAFQEEKGLLWPVQGEVIMKYSKNNTVYFKTLAQYKANPAIAIQAAEGEDVVAAAAGTVTNVSKSEENGTMVTTDIGNGYMVTYGQLKNVKVTKGQVLKEGALIGKIAAPTKYFTEEGSHLYLQVMQNNETVDPLLLLR